MKQTPPDLPETVARVLDAFVAAAREALGDDLRSVVLHGSGAEGRLRPTSDVNLILVLGSFDAARAGELRHPLRAAGAAVRLRCMFLLESEIDEAAAEFGVKFSDLRHRRRVLHGSDPFARLKFAREPAVRRVLQVLLNLELRLREALVLHGDEPDRIARDVVEAAGPLRACAATLLEVEGVSPPPPPREALERVAREVDLPGSAALLSTLSELRRGGRLPVGAGEATMAALIDLARRTRQRAARAAGSGP